ncbi:GP63, leishmanolysin [Leishmania tarentolae]|uniref:GP63, leishmanolysin n=1 Tax=Leishmania tarentolae TaxID=5689 RepID=A0A640KA32_LEITA|nr:GP63, leishmanolysin [Leishmania tarentolae]
MAGRGTTPCWGRCAAPPPTAPRGPACCRGCSGARAHRRAPTRQRCPQQVLLQRRQPRGAPGARRRCGTGACCCCRRTWPCRCEGVCVGRVWRRVASGDALAAL